jgi:uncharacterized protein (TIGR03067 family)
MKLILPALLSMFALAVGALAQDEATKKDMNQIQGSWRLVSRERDGKADPADVIKDILMTHKGDAFTFNQSSSGAGATKGTFKLDASKSPKAIDRIPADGPQKGKTLMGIYKLEGDTLTLCVSVEGKDRPMEFAAKPKSGLVLSVWKREK